MMSGCICQIKPKDFNQQQISSCRGCNMASESGSWCGKWGVYITGDKYPHLIQQAKSFGKATVKQVVAGMPERSHQQITAAMRICKQCPSYVAEDERCKKCGCKMPRKIKWATTRCPLNKW